jgi:hypothetical protein
MSTASTQRVTVSVADCMAIVEGWSLATPALAELEIARRQLAQGTSVKQIVRERRDSLTAAVSQVLTCPSPTISIPVPTSSTAPLTHQVEAAVACYEGVARHAIQDVVVAALQSPQIGFSHIRVCSAAEGTAIEARRGHSVVQVVVHSDLTIERDWALGPGDACVPLDDELTRQLTAHGIVTTSVWMDRHGGRRDGAHLIDVARATDPAEPVRGAVQNLASAKTRHRARKPARVIPRSVGAQEGAR